MEQVGRAAEILGLSGETEGILADVRFICLILGVSLLPVAMLLDAVPLWLIAVAVVLAVVVWFHPAEAAPAGVLFLFLGSVVLPVADLDAPSQTPYEMYFWAAGLFVITAATAARLGSRILKIPTSAKMFLAVAVLAAAYGMAQGISFGYVLRQFYGIVLLFVYLASAIHFGDEKLFVRRIQTYGFICALLFLVYYAAVFAQGGLEKQMNPAGPEAALLATVLLASSLQEKKLFGMVAAVALMLVPALLLSRSALLTPLVAAFLVPAIVTRSKTLKVVFCAGAIALGLVGTVPAVATVIGDASSTVFGANSPLPEGIFRADTLLGRAMQLVSAIGTVRAHPFLGAGLGSNFEWFEPDFGWMQAAFVDNGWAYLLAKMGAAGFVTFLWFLNTVARQVSRETAALSACFLTVTFITMFSQASYFHFTQASLTGTIVGLLLARAYRKIA